MTEKPTVTIERVDDIPVLLASMDHLGLAELVDEHFVPHKNWDGMSLGKVLSGWLTHILSEGDHRLNQVQDWAAKRAETLKTCLSSDVRALDFADDRLAVGLDMLGDDKAWEKFEAALNKRTLRVYDLQPQRVRIDSSTANGHWHVTEDGMFQFGHSKDHRPDLPQVKVMLATLDPLGMPVATQVVSGEKADDPLYIPAIDQVRVSVGQRGLLYVGDCKLMALATRAHLEAGGDKYLGPFSMVQVSQATLDDYLKPVWSNEQPLTPVNRRGADGQDTLIAEGFERSVTLTATVAGKTVTWEERHLVARSLAHARSAEAALRARLAHAQTAIAALNEHKQGKAPFTDLDTLRKVVDAILKKHAVEGLLAVQYKEHVEQQHVRKYRTRPAETRIERNVQVLAQLHQTSLEDRIRRLGWRVYGTNCPQSELSLEQGLLAYREEYLIEHNFGRLKGKSLSLTPMYLADDQRATGLIRLLSVGLRILTLLEHVVRRGLAKTGAALAGLYAGNPKRTTRRPTTEALLRSFKDIFLSVVTVGEHTYRHLTPLSPLQQMILNLLGLSETIYTILAADSANPP